MVSYKRSPSGNTMVRLLAWLAVMAAWIVPAEAAGEPGTRVFIIEEGRFSAREIARVLTLAPERENTVVFGTRFGVEVTGKAQEIAAALAEKRNDDNARPPTIERMGSIAAIAYDRAADYFRRKAEVVSESERPLYQRVDFVVLAARMERDGARLSADLADSCFERQARAVRVKLDRVARIEGRPNGEGLTMSYLTGPDEGAPVSVVRAVAITFGLLDDKKSTPVTLIAPACPQLGRKEALVLADFAKTCDPEAAAKLTPTRLAPAICPPGAEEPVSESAPRPKPKPEPPVSESIPPKPKPKPQATAEATPADVQPQPQPQARPAPAGTRLASRSPDAALNSGPTFSFFSPSRRRQNASLDVRIVETPPGIRGRLWMAPPQSDGPPRESDLLVSGDRVSISLEEGAEESSVRHIYLALEALPDCRPDTAGWARIEANGSWFSSANAGDYTIGAALFDCSRRWTVLEILSVRP